MSRCHRAGVAETLGGNRAEGGSESAGTAWVMGYERGTLTVDATDRRLGSLVWYGEASAARLRAIAFSVMMAA